MNQLKLFRIAVAAMITGASINGWATVGDTAIAYLNVSGNVPAIMSVQARGIPGDLDLSPGAIVIDRIIGILHFKFNESATIKWSAVATGSYTFTAAIKIGAVGGCTSHSAAFNTTGGVTLTGVATDYASAAAGALAAGIEEDCAIGASWTGTATALPLAGIYKYVITITMAAI